MRIIHDLHSVLYITADFVMILTTLSYCSFCTMEDAIIHIAAIINILMTAAICRSVDVRHVRSVAEASDRACVTRQGDDD